MKYLKYFRLTLVVFTLTILTLAGKASLDSYESLNLIVKNKTSDPWRFGFNSMVKGETREVFFKGSFSPSLIQAGENLPLGRDEKRDRIVGVYLEGKKKQFEISCPQGFSFYSVEIQAEGARCIGTNHKIIRWIATLPYTPFFIDYYLSSAKELLAPEV